MLVPLLLMDICNCGNTWKYLKRNVNDGRIRLRKYTDKFKSQHTFKNTKKEKTTLLEEDKAKEPQSENSKLGKEKGAVKVKRVVRPREIQMKNSNTDVNSIAMVVNKMANARPSKWW